MIRIGPAGWKYKDWEGVVYPKLKPRGFDELAYLSRYFDAIEINTSYYGPPRPTTAKKWVESISENGNFRFTAKLFHSFTHERKPAPNDERDFKAGIAPIADGGRLGALLIQFPWSFKSSPENVEYLTGLQKRFSEYPLVVEVRHASWIEDDVLELLSELGVGICNIDQPLFHRSVQPAAHVTSRVGYVRLHGRNYMNWFSKKADVRERYDHLYSIDELEPWITRAKQVAEDTDDSYVVSNNHFLGKAVVNALEIASVLKEQPVPAPPQLLDHYPELKDFTSTDGRNGNLFS
ncbi:MAG TPA: DUF72 domain-containing protein [Bryobacteraceae bacterium]|nr:DUF72 domain-containing protein [Bryobacteraceae bacterium]